MQDNSIYKDIAKRTGGDIYIGVVGPVRTGKSTFIHKFLDNIVLPNIEDEYDRERTIDEIPQSATGRTVMTTEPKFVPDESVKINVGETELNVKMIDCVGYLVDGALGSEEDGVERMIMTPWSESAMPFKEAAELGTSKVIGEHSTIGMLVTTDGSITDIPRENYIEAEERVADELKKLGKPFAIVLNSARPGSDEAKALALELEEKYGVPVALVSCPDLDAEDIREILALVLGQFPIKELRFKLPEWTMVLPEDHPIREEMIAQISAFTDDTYKIGDVQSSLEKHNGIVMDRIDAGDGTGEMSIPLTDDVYYETMREMTGLEVGDKKSLFATVTNLANIKQKYEKISDALAEVESKGYGIVMPSANDMRLDEPRLVKQSGGYGVKVSARAESIHMIKTGIRADLCPVVGTAEQSEEVLKHLIAEYEDDPERVWQSNMFGKSLYDLVSDGMRSKLEHMSDESRVKLGETLERIINEGAGGLLCILL
ncbi:MAG: stage IV sporulation protein A [Clostridia bacterium]|nr:stage IV sporulation protein A [Clostridia bacterium]